ncbi:hypothetical protein ElyMa_000601300 [Elysia marginata]|uniref:CCHC-type domain-containing protein n=1 Tax=Elysia marginata TaxID=1093978 RepID=A0AAV4G8J5_9GAST|nr:hypothetical protein ElyMa_000601300 [Elysia marginata]
MAGIPQIPLPYLDWDNPNKQKAFDEWKDFMSSYLTINKIAKAEMWNYILLSTGPKGRDLLLASGISEEGKKDPESVWAVFKNHLIEKPNKWVQRIELQSYIQKENGTIEEFVLRLKTKADKCNFSTTVVKEERIIEQIIKGCRYQEEKKKLLGKTDLTMAQAIEILKNYEATVKSLSEYKSASRYDSKPEQSQMDYVKHRSKDSKKQCTKCGSSHSYSQCPAFRTNCARCKKPNHWAKMCRAGASAAEGDRNHHNKGNPKKSSAKPSNKWYKKGKYTTYKKWIPQQTMMSSTSTQWIQQ